MEQILELVLATVTGFGHGIDVPRSRRCNVIGAVRNAGRLRVWRWDASRSGGAGSIQLPMWEARRNSRIVVVRIPMDPAEAGAGISGRFWHANTEASISISEGRSE